MEIALLTPLAALFALAALVPLAVFLGRERDVRRIRASLWLAEPSRRSRLSVAVALVAVCALLGLAAAQPVVATTRVLPERTDAQVFVVLDTSRSMLASAEPGAPTRFERARSLAIALGDRLPEVPIGVASITDDLLPHLFPTTDRRVFVATIEKSIDVERPPPSTLATVATALEGLASAPTKNYFPQSAQRRVLVVFTDGETRPVEFPSEFATAFRKAPRVQTVFVRLWGANERIYETGVAEVGYRPDPASEADLAQIASLAGGRVVSEGDAGDLGQVVSDLLGTGPTIDREHEGRRRALMPWITLAALLPLGFVLLRRNL